MRQLVGPLRRLAKSLRRPIDVIRRGQIASASMLCISRWDRHNIGDIKAAPREYFDFLRDFKHIDIKEDFGRHNVDLASKLVVVGGGGILYFNREMERLGASRGSTLICWGAGHNTHGSDQIGRIDLLDRFALVGIRDFGYGYEWVPCVSCMDPAFDRAYPIAHDVVIYEHRWFSGFDNDASIPRLNNSCTHFGKVIAFLGSAETVVTTSYHGAYWATLLGRKALVVDPFSTKFYGFKHRPVLCSSAEWRHALERACVYPEALAECRAANQAFAERVAEVVECHRRNRAHGSSGRPAFGGKR
jgi:hypothetical protein